MTVTFRSRRTLLLLGAVAVVIVVAAIGLLRVLGGDPEPAGLGVRTVQAGAVEVRMTALRLDRGGAEFRLVLDTHSVELDVDLPTAAQLRVGGALVDAGAWQGTGPGGHHREGTLTYLAAVPAGAAVELRVTGLPADAVASWTAP